MCICLQEVQQLNIWLSRQNISNTHFLLFLHVFFVPETQKSCQTLKKAAMHSCERLLGTTRCTSHSLSSELTVSGCLHSSLTELLHLASTVSLCKPKLQMEIEIHNRFRANIQHTKVTSQWMQFATSMERQWKESKWSFEESVIYKLMQDQHFVSSAQRHPWLDIKYVKDLSLGNFLGSYQCFLQTLCFHSQRGQHIKILPNCSIYRLNDNSLN